MKKVAIYSRKSVFTAKGESIENQIELCKNYCETYLKCTDFEYLVYEDEGFSGKNTNRPKFKELITDIKSKKIDILICYRLDRISRNVADFSSTLELLQKYDVNFISIKEQFDTSTPMGRAMIYIASVFAQLERETIAERVKDNMLQLAKMGKWSGGQLPLGYSSQKNKFVNKEMKEKSFVVLIPIAEELEIVRFIYHNYLTNDSIQNIVNELNSNGCKTKTQCNFESTGVKRILRSPLYVESNEATNEYLKTKDYNVFGVANGNGYLTYNKKTDKDNIIIAVSNHKGIISPSDWLNTQRKLDENTNKSKEVSNRAGTGSNETLFCGLLKCGKCGSNMVIKYNSKNKDGKNYIYYACSNKEKKYLVTRCDASNLRCDIVDMKIIDKLKTYNKNTIIKIYNNKLNALLQDSNKQTISNLNSQIDEKKLQIRNLITELSLITEESIKEIFRDKINLLSVELKQLNLTIANSELTKKNINNVILNIKHLIQNFIDFDKYFDNTADINIKRTLLRNIIESITYDDVIKNFRVNFFLHG